MRLTWIQGLYTLKGFTLQRIAISLMLMLGTTTLAKVPPPIVSIDTNKPIFQQSEGIPLIVTLSGTSAICGPTHPDQWAQRLDIQVFRVGNGLLTPTPVVLVAHKKERTKVQAISEVKPFRFRVNLKLFQFQNQGGDWLPGTYTVRAAVHVCDPDQPSQEYVIQSRNKVVFIIDTPYSRF